MIYLQVLWHYIFVWLVSPLESPCSPRIHPLKLLGCRPSLSPIRYRKRAESRLVPLPMTRCSGRPLSFQVTYVKTSTVRAEKRLRANQRWNVWCCVFLGTWVGHDDEDAVGTVSDDLRDDAFEDVDVSLHQIQSALALLLTHACRHHHDTRVSRHGVIYRTNPAVQEGQTTERSLKTSSNYKHNVLINQM